MSHENDLVRQVTVHFKDGSVAIVNRFGLSESAIIQQVTDENTALAAENERLRKAGDAMAESINFDDQRSWEDWGNRGKSLLRDCVIDWIIAKRGGTK